MNAKDKAFISLEKTYFKYGFCSVKMDYYHFVNDANKDYDKEKAEQLLQQSKEIKSLKKKAKFNTEKGKAYFQYRFFCGYGVRFIMVDGPIQPDNNGVMTFNDGNQITLNQECLNEWNRRKPIIEKTPKPNTNKKK